MQFQKGFSLIIVMVSIGLLLSLVGGFFIYQSSQSKAPAILNTVETTNSESNKPLINFETIEVLIPNISDAKTIFYFSDAKKLYKANFNGSQIEEVAAFRYNIATIDLLPDGTLLIYTDDSRYERVVNKQAYDADYKQITTASEYWLVKPASDKPEKIDLEKYSSLKNYKNVEKIYTKELPDGQAEILIDKLDGAQPAKIGLLEQKLVTSGCEIEPCPGKRHPYEFYPSFDGSYLLNKPPGGGGLGQSGVVVSRDGSKSYKIDFYWFVSSAVWIGNDKLLTKAQDGKQKIFTFKDDGTFSELPLEEELLGDFGQESLSPSKKLLFISNQSSQNSLFDIALNKSVPIEIHSEEQIRKQFNLLPEEIIEQRDLFLGWNINSDKLMFASTTGVISGTHNNDRTIAREIKLFDVQSGKVYTIAKLNPDPSNPDDYLVNGKPKADITHFAIR